MCSYGFTSFFGNSCFIALNIQLRLDEITNCEVYIGSERTTKASGITTRLSQGVEGLCACGLSPSLLTDEFSNYFDGASSHVTYRAVLAGSETVSTIQLARLMEQWVENGPIVLASVWLIVVRLSLLTSIVRSALRTLNVGKVAGWVVARVFAIAVLVLIVIVVLLLLSLRMFGSRDMSDERTGSQPTE